MAKVEIENSFFIVILLNFEQGVALPVAPFPPCIVESVESTNNSPAALKQAVARASSVMHRVIEERAPREQDRWQREMNRREREIRTQRERESRMEREARELVEANKWPQQQRAITGPGCTSLLEMVSSFHFCSTFLE